MTVIISIVGSGHLVIYEIDNLITSIDVDGNVRLLQFFLSLQVIGREGAL